MRPPARGRPRHLSGEEGVGFVEDLTGVDPGGDAGYAQCRERGGPSSHRAAMVG